MEGSENWSTTGISLGTDNVFSICKWHDRKGKQLHKSICRWCEITKVDKKPQGLWQVAEQHKYDIWMEQDMGNRF